MQSNILQLEITLFSTGSSNNLPSRSLSPGAKSTPNPLHLCERLFLRFFFLRQNHVLTALIVVLLVPAPSLVIFTTRLENVTRAMPPELPVPFELPSPSLLQFDLLGPVYVVGKIIDSPAKDSLLMGPAADASYWNVRAPFLRVPWVVDLTYPSVPPQFLPRLLPPTKLIVSLGSSPLRYPSYLNFRHRPPLPYVVSGKHCPRYLSLLSSHSHLH